jgi:hypothetical protein
MLPPVVPAVCLVPCRAPSPSCALLLALVAAACTRPNPAFQPQGQVEVESIDAGSLPGARRLPDGALPPSPDVALDLAGLETPPGPAGVALTDPSGSPPIAPRAPGGMPFGASCGPNRVLTGLIGTSGAGGLVGLDSVQPRCADLLLDPPLVLGTGDSIALAEYGTVGDVRYDGTCPANQVVTGIEGATGQWIDRLYVFCAALTVRQTPGGLAAAVEAPTRLEVPVGPPSQGSVTAAHCPAGAIAVGIEGNSGFAVDLLALRCARPTLR